MIPSLRALNVLNSSSTTKFKHKTKHSNISILILLMCLLAFQDLARA